MIPPGADLSKIPMAENPNGNPPNFVNPPTQNATVLAVGLPFAIISTCFVVLRLVTNFKNLRHFGLDDCMKNPYEAGSSAKRLRDGWSCYISDLCVAAQILTTVYFGLHVSCEYQTIFSSGKDVKLIIGISQKLRAPCLRYTSLLHRRILCQGGLML